MMAGCGGNCQCAAKSERPRDPVSLADSIARVVVDNRIVKFTLEYSRNFPLATVDEIIIAATMAKERGELV